jgi:hypothetical protein
LENLEASKDVLTASIPSEWEAANARHVALQKTESTARINYRKAADQGYTNAQTLVATLQATTSLRELGAALPDMKTLMATNEPADLLEPLKELSAQFGNIEGASKIKSAVSKARSALRKKKPNPEAAMKSIDKAMAEYEKEMQWRDTAESAISDDLAAYEELMRNSIGVRQQDKLNREQALFVASCSSHHRDISLNF